MENKLIMWDIDGTIMFCGSSGTIALNKTIKELYGIENAFERAGIGQAMDAVLLDRILNEFSISEPDLNAILSLYASNLSELLRDNPDVKTLPGVTLILDAIEQHPYLFNGILTSNFKLGAHSKLSAVKLLNYFHVGGYGDTFGEKWDAALICQSEAEQQYGVVFKPKNVFIIGDSKYDIICARRLGMTSIGVATGWTDYETLLESEPDYLFSDLGDFRKILQILEGTEA